MYEKTEPFRVIIDESIELAKEFGSLNSPKFVNGILGKIVEEIEPKDNEKPLTA
jgi:N utilization substance protein B